MAVGPWPERGVLPSGRRNCRPGTGLSDSVETLKGPRVRLLLAETTIRTPSRRPALLLSARIGATSRFCGAGEAEHGAVKSVETHFAGVLVPGVRLEPVLVRNTTGLGAEGNRSRRRGGRGPQESLEGVGEDWGGGGVRSWSHEHIDRSRRC